MLHMQFKKSVHYSVLPPWSPYKVIRILLMIFPMMYFSSLWLIFYNWKFVALKPLYLFCPYPQPTPQFFLRTTYKVFHWILPLSPTTETQDLLFFSHTHHTCPNSQMERKKYRELLLFEIEVRSFLFPFITSSSLLLFNYI